MGEYIPRMDESIDFDEVFFSAAGLFEYLADEGFCMVTSGPDAPCQNSEAERKLQAFFADGLPPSHNPFAGVRLIGTAYRTLMFADEEAGPTEEEADAEFSTMGYVLADVQGVPYRIQVFG